jgi:hypothetical protein
MGGGGRKPYGKDNPDARIGFGENTTPGGAANRDAGRKGARFWSNPGFA